MKRYIIILPFFTNLFIFINGNAQNQDDLLYIREQKALNLYSEINIVSERYGRFLVVRDKNLHGENGIQAKYLQCIINMGQWVKDWTHIFATIDLKNKIDANTMQVQVQNILSRQVSNAESLKRTCGQIQSDVNSALRLLENSPKYNPEILSNYKNILAETENMKEKLTQVLQSFGSSPITRIDKLEYLITLSKKASLAKLKIELLNNARIPLEKTLQEFQNILAASKLADSALANIMHYENNMNEYTLNFQYFKAKKLLTQVQKECAEKKNELNSSSISKIYLKSAIERLDTLCKASEEHFTFFTTLNSPKYEYVFNYSQLVNANINLKCDLQNNIVACNKLAVLNSLEKETLKNLPEPKLEYIEDQLDSIYQEYKK
ncbi:hypothetical protein [Fluviispira multicolorata]|uniref:Uncharacterized protein n=1 Tax=Fluviispira multicolorata TaxID=2654512 RepID=A0A833JBS4_9BACT|nr:hypothetical protein [Fluviispira multicolorata]KAB8029816.1 hypothetical protein GCL57_09765 [Fluviispira multicolorata]